MFSKKQGYFLDLSFRMIPPCIRRCMRFGDWNCPSYKDTKSQKAHPVVQLGSGQTQTDPAADATQHDDVVILGHHDLPIFITLIRKHHGNNTKTPLKQEIKVCLDRVTDPTELEIGSDCHYMCLQPNGSHGSHPGKLRHYYVAEGRQKLWEARSNGTGDQNVRSPVPVFIHPQPPSGRARFPSPCITLHPRGGGNLPSSPVPPCTERSRC